MQDDKPVPAATVVVMRESSASGQIEVLLLRRNSKLVFHGGHWVFPGGRLDEADFLAAGTDLEYPAALKAAVRETKEEAGIELAESDLLHTAHWTTPPRLPRRFCTWFFIYPLTIDVEVQVDNDEILDYRWVNPRDALTEAQEGAIVLPRPTKVTLQDMLPFTDMDSALAHFNQAPVRVFPVESRYYRPEEMGCPP